jgi:hypothetical protein
LLAFNLGIEAMQLILLICVVPALLVLCRTSPEIYAATRRFASVAAVVLAALWVLQRLGNASMDAIPLLGDGGAALAWIPGLLWPLVSYGRRRLRAVAAPAGR